MGKIVPIVIFLLLVLGGCSDHSGVKPAEAHQKKGREYQNSKKASEEISAFKAQKAAPVPPMILPPVFKPISVFSEQSVTFSAENARLRKILYTISKLSGLNLIIDSDVDTTRKLTLTLNEAPLEDALDIVMELSGCHYVLKGNILHVKKYMRKTFFIPYVHSNTSFDTKLGGDILGAAQGGGSDGGTGGSGGGSGGEQGLQGSFALQFSNPEEMNDFYQQLEENVRQLLSENGNYTLNRFSGTMVVYDTKEVVESIGRMLEQIKKTTQRQVLIEAKILEVVLDKSHQFGVQWETVLDNIVSAGPTTIASSVVGTFTYTNNNFSAVLKALNTAGDVDTLSNPRIKVLSGQSAILSSGKLVPFWEKEVQYAAVSSGGSATVAVPEITYNRRDVLDGISLGVTPTILENGKIMLNVVPITSNIEDVVDFFDENGKSVASAPLLNIKEAGSIIYANDNDMVLIGGLINNTKKVQKEKVPILGDIPGLGKLFTASDIKDEKRELVILLRMNVIEL